MTANVITIEKSTFQIINKVTIERKTQFFLANVEQLCIPFVGNTKSLLHLPTNNCLINNFAMI